MEEMIFMELNSYRDQVSWDTLNREIKNRYLIEVDVGRHAMINRMQAPEDHVIGEVLKDNGHYW